MKLTNRAVTTLFGLAAAATALTGLTAPTASATTTQVTAGCYRSSCNGQDPVDMGCNTDAYTVESAWSEYGTIELRYSPSCKANWARLSGGTKGQWFWVENASTSQWWEAKGSDSFGNMVDGSGPARACLQQGACTGQH
ncbi:DUF2690 domain-containing protein [Kitasatospora sp. NPDC036755]|uniref:DUF2690 domain-containing protein n=1 Tax=Kitasatospora sp. NPDC036755 TaxID=3154600 RepID=UPI0033DDCDF9